jgi:hypothetical protein
MSPGLMDSTLGDTTGEVTTASAAGSTAAVAAHRGDGAMAMSPVTSPTSDTEHDGITILTKANGLLSSFFTSIGVARCHFRYKATFSPTSAALPAGL